jgi:hypothetical protein
MLGAIVGIVLLFQTGVNPLSLGVATATTVLTIISRCLFGSKRL